MVRHLLPLSLCSKTTVNRVSTPSTSNITYSEHIFFIWREAQTDVSLNRCFMKAAEAAARPQPLHWVGRRRRGVGPSCPLRRGLCLSWEVPCLSDSYRVSHGHPWPKWGTSPLPGMSWGSQTPSRPSHSHHLTSEPLVKEKRTQSSSSPRAAALFH